MSNPAVGIKFNRDFLEFIYTFCPIILLVSSRGFFYFYSAHYKFNMSTGFLYHFKFLDLSTAIIPGLWWL